uniref:DUF4434 domain-containing protein n=1 Tax=uncultured Draconibacterium sp. TaxID=1573823 RepID=UPI0032178220
MKRRKFCLNLATAALGAGICKNSLALPVNSGKKTKPIVGSWFEFQHHSQVEGKYWNPTLEAFTEKDWTVKVKEVADAGIKYLVLLDVAIYDKSFYPSQLMPQHQLGCPDPLETVLSAADKYGIRFFISNGFFGNWYKPYDLIVGKEVHKLRIKAMEELTEKYSHHKSFYGWYYPNETGIQGYYDDAFINYVNKCTKEVNRLTPKTKTLIAPYGTRSVETNEKFINSLDKLNVDFIAYQDEVGVRKSKTDETARFFEQLYKMHKQVGKAKLWADVEVFEFEGETYRSALLPASPERVIQQLEAISPFVEKILIYQYTGLINNPESHAFAGHQSSTKLYTELVKHNYLK